MSKEEGKKPDARKTRNSKSYKKARNRAEDYLKSPDKLGKLVNDASEKAQAKTAPLAGVRDSLMACFRMIKAYANGSYREVPWQSLVMIVASVTYFVMPVDLVPDFIVGLGLVDDVALLGWTIRTFDADIEAFTQWEKARKAA